MARTFPLYLTHFEKYMLNDDSVDYPMTFVVQFRLKLWLQQRRERRSLPPRR